MITNEQKNIIKKALEGIDYEKIILFGSRARGDNRTDSDFDLMIIVSKNISIYDKFKLQKIIRSSLAKSLLDGDVIVKSKDEITNDKNTIGNIVKYAMMEGKEI